MQTIASVFLFFLVHIPLSRISPYFSLATVLIPLTLSQPTKIYIYQKTRIWTSKMTFNEVPPIHIFNSTCKEAERLKDVEIKENKNE